MFKKLAFTMYPVQDWKRARAFYGETLEVDDLDEVNAELKAKGVRYKAE